MAFALACSRGAMPAANSMIKFAADEDFNNDIIRGLRRRRPDRDVLRVQDAGLSGAPDPAVLAWAADAGRVLLTHDVSTMTRYAYERVTGGQPMPGLFEVARSLPIGLIIEDLLLIHEYSSEDDWIGKVWYLPLA